MGDGLRWNGIAYALSVKWRHRYLSVTFPCARAILGGSVRRCRRVYEWYGAEPSVNVSGCAASVTQPERPPA